MPVPAGLRPGAVKVRRIAIAVGCRCELCQDRCRPDLLEIHLVMHRDRAPRRREDLHCWILVLCPRCHRDLHRHRCPVEDQLYLVSLRDPRANGEIRGILRSRPCPYTAPETFDPEQFFSNPSPVPWGWVV